MLLSLLLLLLPLLLLLLFLMSALSRFLVFLALPLLLLLLLFPSRFLLVPSSPLSFAAAFYNFQDFRDCVVNGSSPLGLLGKPSFTQPANSTDAATAKDLNNPISVRTNPVTGDVFVADNNNNRLLVYFYSSLQQQASSSNGSCYLDLSADAVVGQANFTASTTALSAKFFGPFSSVSKLALPRRFF